jgi:hypothetical protein
MADATLWQKYASSLRRFYAGPLPTYFTREIAELL